MLSRILFGSIFVLVQFFCVTSWAKMYLENKVYGSPDAPITIHVYESLGCGACKNVHENNWSEFKKAYIDTQKVRVIQHNFVLYQQDLNALLLARCGGAERYEGFVDLIYKRQADWMKSDGYMDVLTQLGFTGGVTVEEFAGCQNNEQLQNFILDEQSEAQKFGVKFVPSVRLPDGEIIEFPRSLEAWEKVLNQ